MGRHSAGDADLDDQLEEVAEPSTGDESGGRHARTGEDDADDRAAAETAAVETGGVEAGEGASGAAIDDAAAAHRDTEPIDLIAAIGGRPEVGPRDEAPAAELATPSAAAAREEEAESPGDASGAAPVTPRAPSGTRADLKLLRQSANLRVRCIGAVVATFLIYTVVLIVLGRTDVYLLWVWIPTVLSGILVGSFLDAAHRRIARATDPPDDVAMS
ncbi:hypothetical protein M6B22_12500 [Jatrophihabitans cynanchi]|uniref:2TM domain-containing protein n=1 Tax=Jatrophihabitans cynanchi TaxID=2944128 RepID=A0ABY7JW99_9ACTN|nr:hypothetical protein [Jatrophihabitans sp. SB3-54]WAX55366.1 hypothetical protein M6B22_12500 [Jatrophihabitans sp. SB3-54]